MSEQSLRQRAYEFIHNQILSGDLPAGSRVSEQSLAKEIGISRTPVREAIRLLEIEGLVEPVSRFGTIVRSPQRHELVELFELREALESYAVSQAAQKIAAEDLETLGKLCDEIGRLVGELEQSKQPSLDADQLQRFLAADLGFHLRLMQAAGNGKIMKIIGESRVMMRIFGTRRQEHDLSVLRETHRFHQSILDAVRRGDGEAARRQMADHIRTSQRETLASFDRQTASQSAVPPIPLRMPPDLVAALARIESGPAS